MLCRRIINFEDNDTLSHVFCCFVSLPCYKCFVTFWSMKNSTAGGRGYLLRELAGADYFFGLLRQSADIFAYHCKRYQKILLAFCLKILPVGSEWHVSVYQSLSALWNSLTFYISGKFIIRQHTCSRKKRYGGKWKPNRRSGTLVRTSSVFVLISYGPNCRPPVYHYQITLIPEFKSSPTFILSFSVHWRHFIT